MKRYDCLKELATRVSEDDLVIANLAATTVEWQSLFPSDGNLNYVGMGMVVPIANGVALALPQRRVIALDGDGGALFDLSAFGTIAHTLPDNLCVIVFDNESYNSTGKWASATSLTSKSVDIAGVAQASGINKVTEVSTVSEFKAAIDDVFSSKGPAVIVAKINRENVFSKIMSMDGKENKYRFVRHVEQLEGKKILIPSAREHGQPPLPDPLSYNEEKNSDFATVLYDGIKENGFDFVVGLPCSGMSKAQSLCIEDPSIHYVGVAHEGTGFGLCLGAWLGGLKPVVLVENFGFFAGAYQLMRGHYHYGVPLLVVSEYRGDAGDTEFYSKAGEVTEEMFRAMYINHQVVRELQQLKPAIRDGWRWANHGLRPYGVIPTFDLSRPRH